MRLSFTRPSQDQTGPRRPQEEAIGIWPIAVLLLAGLLLRLVIAFVIAPEQGLSEDLKLFEGWALTLADHGPGAFYANGGFTDYPPGYLYFLWPIGIAGRILSGLTGQSAEAITHGLLKLPAILADLAIAALLYRSAGRWFGGRAGLIAAGLFLFVPFTWYESALWGQMDSVGVLFMLAALLLLIEGWSEPAVAFAVFAIVIKPQYIIGLAVLGPILLRRHLLRRGSGPVPNVTGRLVRLDEAIGGWFTRRQGIERLVACAFVAVAVFLVALAPFDIWFAASGPITGLPFVDHVRGYLALTTSQAGFYHVLTANAFNAWALVGPQPLTSELSRTFLWTFDSLPIIGPIPAVVVGALLLGIVGVLVAAVLLVRDEGLTIIVGFTVLAFAFYALPTRVHERYEYPVLVTAALMAATSVRWRWWYVAVAVLGTVNLHAILTLDRPGFATPGLIGAPFGDLARTDAVVALVSLGMTLMFGVLLVWWVVGLLRPTLKVVLASRARPLIAAAPLQSEAMIAASSLVAPAAITAPATEEPTAVARPRQEQQPDVAMPDPSWAFRLRMWILRAPSAENNSSNLASEGGGHLDRRDLLIALLILIGTFGTRIYRIDTPPTMYFDELYYPSTGAEFLQDWRYAIPTNIFEYTHPHVSKYLMAASLATFGDDHVTSTTSVGTSVRDVAFQPAIYDTLAPGGYLGDRIAVATGSEVLIFPHGDLANQIAVGVPGASLVVFGKEDRLYVATSDGAIDSVEGAALQVAGLSGAPAPVVHPIVHFPKPIKAIWSVATNRLIVETDDEVLHVVDGVSGAIVASAPAPGLRGLVAIPVKDRSLVVVSLPDGLSVLDSSNLTTASTVKLDGPPLGLQFVDGSQFGWANRMMLPVPTLYVALDSNLVEAVQVNEDGTLKPFDTTRMPGPVSQVAWDEPTNMVHVLGKTADGRPTIYVIEPHTNAVFADAALPFEPVAWTLDVQPHTPNLDRERAIAFSSTGQAVIIDTGSHAFAWRLPGVIAGALMAALMFVLARMLFRRRSVGVFLAIVMALDGLLFTQGRIAMNDSILGLFIVAAFTLLIGLMRYRRDGPVGRLAPLIGLPIVGILLGLAFGTKWVGAYAIGGAALMLLAQSRIGRRLALSGMVVLTGVLGFQALAGSPPNLTFLLIMIALTVATALVVVRSERVAPDGQGSNLPAWLDPRKSIGLPFIFALGCLLVLPALTYVATYIPWALSVSGGPQLFPGWPPGHTGQTFLDLQAQMYAYHNDLRLIHGQSSPWWAWPLGLRPIWGYYDTFSDGTQSLMLLTSNPVLLWMSIPAMAFGAWQAWRRRSAALGLVIIALLALWIPWARIDRVAFNYHWYTVLPFVFLLLAYFLAELWHGPSARTWALAKVSFAVVLVTPALMWLLRDPLCTAAGVTALHPDSFECTRDLSEVILPIGAWLLGALVVGWFVLGMANVRRFVIALLGLAAAVFVAFLPAMSAWRIPNGLPLIYQGLLPSWDITFAFNGNQNAPVSVPLLGPGALLVAVATAAIVWVAVRASRKDDRPSSPAPPLIRGLAQVSARFGRTTSDPD